MPGRSAERSRWLQTPCALRLGGPNRTSQPLTPSVAPWVLPRDLRSRVRHRSPVFRQEDGTPRRQDPACRHPVRDDVIPEPRVPSAGSISILRSSEALRVPCYVRAKVLAPFRPMRSDSSRQDGSAVPRYSEPISVCLSAPLDGAEKMPLSDLCNRLTTRAPVDRSISGPAACAALIAGFFPFPKVGFSHATPDHLAAIQPRLGACLTARLQLRPSRTRLLLAFRLGGCRGSACLTVPPWLGVVGHAQSWRSNL
jgi:hypothetical protein